GLLPQQVATVEITDGQRFGHGALLEVSHSFHQSRAASIIRVHRPPSRTVTTGKTGARATTRPAASDTVSSPTASPGYSGAISGCSRSTRVRREAPWPRSTVT